MSFFKSLRTPVCYITGEIRLEYAPPHGFNLEPAVNVDDVASRVAPLEGGTATAWLYLAIVTAGSHKVSVSFGGLTATQDVQVESGKVGHLDFFFVEK